MNFPPCPEGIIEPVWVRTFYSSTCSVRISAFHTFLSLLSLRLVLVLLVLAVWRTEYRHSDLAVSRALMRYLSQETVSGHPLLLANSQGEIDDMISALFLSAVCTLFSRNPNTSNSRSLRSPGMCSSGYVPSPSSGRPNRPTRSLDSSGDGFCSTLLCQVARNRSDESMGRCTGAAGSAFIFLHSRVAEKRTREDRGALNGTTIQ